jgi:hypothetical protein
MNSMRLILCFLVAALLVGCTSTFDIADKYHDVVGRKFRTRRDGYLNQMTRFEYDIAPYTLSPSRAKDDPAVYKKEIAFIPAGTLLTVVAAKRRYAGGDWDFLLVEVELPGTTKKIRFEEMLGFSSFDPRDVDKRWIREPLKTEPNQSLQPTALLGRG